MTAARLLVAALLGPLVLAACAPVDKGYWWRPDVTTDEFNRDDYQCIKENLATSYQSDRYLGTVTTTPRTAVNEELYDRCMIARGYRIVPRDFVPPSKPFPTAATRRPARRRPRSSGDVRRWSADIPGAGATTTRPRRRRARIPGAPGDGLGRPGGLDGGADPGHDGIVLAV